MMAKNNMRPDFSSSRQASAVSSVVSRRGGEAAAVSQEAIAKKAHEKFLMRGSVHGYDQQDWLEAEKELRSEFQRGRNN